RRIPSVVTTGSASTSGDLPHREAREGGEGPCLNAGGIGMDGPADGQLTDDERALMEAFFAHKPGDPSFRHHAAVQHFLAAHPENARTVDFLEWARNRCPTPDCPLHKNATDTAQRPDAP